MIFKLCGAQASSINIIWEHVKNVKFLDPATDQLNQALGMEPAISVLTSSPG